MDNRTAAYLSELDRRFYAGHAASFSETRSSPWRGWEPVLRLLQKTRGPVSALDVACGNMRLERYLREGLAGRGLSYLGLDGCAALVPKGREGSFAELDIVGGLLSGNLPEPAALLPDCDLVACFGFFHHVPGRENRARLLRWLVGCARPGGIVAASFWRFMDDRRMATRARATTQRALGRLADLDAGELEEGDFFLGWQDDKEALRYCHHFDDAEVGSLVGSVSDIARPLARYHADGRSGDLNGYAILRRR